MDFNGSMVVKILGKIISALKYLVSKPVQIVRNQADSRKSSQPESYLHRVWRSYKRSKTALVGGCLVLIYVIFAIFAPYIAPHDPIQPDMLARLDGPSLEHPLGLDGYGRDVLSRIIFGSRASLLVGLSSIAIAAIIGVIYGGLSAYLGGNVDMITMRFVDMVMCFPSVLLALVIVAILGAHVMNIILAIGFTRFPRFARIMRGAVLSVKEEDYVEAARATGATDARIITKHIFPNCASSLLVVGTLNIATAILVAAGLAFLGMGLQPPTPEWGAMVSGGRRYMLVAPHVAFFPGMAIMFAVMGFNMLGDGLRDALDPKMGS